MELRDWLAKVEAQPDPVWLVEKLLFAQSTALISGPATLGFKTWFAMFLSLLVSGGRKYGTISASKPTKVLFFEREKAPKPTAQRFRAIEQGCQLPVVEGVDFRHMDPLNLSDATQTGLIADQVREQKIGLVILDTLAKCMRGDENSVEDMSRAMEGIDKWRREGATVLMLHHTKKVSAEFDGDMDIDQQVRGSSALIGFADTHLALRPATTRGMLKLTARHNDAQEFNWDLKWDIQSDDKQVAKSAKLQISEVEEGGRLSNLILDQAVARIAAMSPGDHSLRAIRTACGLSTDAAAIELAGQLISDGILTFDAQTKRYRKVQGLQ